MNINDIPLQRLKEILASDMPLTIVTTEALIARLEQAEAAVARVRAIREGDVCSGCLDVIDEALDGDDRV